MRWVSAATRRVFGEWTEEKHGLCVYINVLAGSIWVAISKPKEGHIFAISKPKEAGDIFANIESFLHQMDPVESNLHLWDVEAILIEEGSQL
jgi:hypothetical protein